jgi:8-oxo-dGTP pyrophosphatase MutT (NUDIX family)
MASSPARGLATPKLAARLFTLPTVASTVVTVSPTTVVRLSLPACDRRKRTPLTAALAWQRARAGQGGPIRRPLQPLSSVPTVDEVSAGGIVIDLDSDDAAVAIIARYNRGGRLEWCLPKGHPEGMENHQEAAIREVEEETGIRGQIVAQLGSIDYWFSVPQYRVHKTVHHFLMIATGGELTTEKDPDHEAVDVAWVPLAQLPKRLSFPNERRIANLAREVIVTHGI